MRFSVLGFRSDLRIEIQAPVVKINLRLRYIRYLPSNIVPFHIVLLPDNGL